LPAGLRVASLSVVNRSFALVLDFLRAEEDRGVTHVHLDDEARGILRTLFLQGKGGGEVIAGPDREAVAVVPTVAVPVVTGATPAERIASLAAQAEDWAAARMLGTLRETMVFSTGNPEADLMLVGEAPGHHEELQREPFVGPAGQKLDDILRAMGLARGQVYISNIVKFRPRMPNQSNNNRKPTPEEMAACLPFVRAEVAVVRPKCIVALGATAAEGLLGLSGAVARMRGTWHSFEGIPARVTYHPAYLIHSNANHSQKRQVWEDMLEVMKLLGMEISPKQQGFFLPRA